jgi:hypothetical protein
MSKIRLFSLGALIVTTVACQSQAHLQVFSKETPALILKYQTDSRYRMLLNCAKR